MHKDVTAQVADDRALTKNIRALFSSDRDRPAEAGEGKPTSLYKRWRSELGAGPVRQSGRVRQEQVTAA